MTGTSRWFVIWVCACAVVGAMKPTKRRKLLDLVGTKGISDSALSAVLQKLRSGEFNLDEGISARTIYREVMKEYEPVECVVKLPQETGPDFDWYVARPDLLMQGLCKECPAYRNIVRAGVESANGDPLKMVTYLDEVVPGNALAVDNKRKSWAVYFTMLDFPQWALCLEEAWLPIAILRTDIVKKVPGGIAACMRALFEMLVFGSCLFIRIGITLLTAVDEWFLLFVKLARTIGDEAALSRMWNTKTAAGLLPCQGCKNVTKLRSMLADGDPYLVEIWCWDPARFDKRTDKDQWASYDRLAANKGVISAADFKLLQQANGFTYNPHGMMSNRALRVHTRPSGNRYDPMHVFSSGGIGPREMFHILNIARKKHGIWQAELQELTSVGWTWPAYIKHAKGKVRALFSKARMGASKKKTEHQMPSLRVSSCIPNPQILRGKCDCEIGWLGRRMRFYVEAFDGLRPDG